VTILDGLVSEGYEHQVSIRSYGAAFRSRYMECGVTLHEGEHTRQWCLVLCDYSNACFYLLLFHPNYSQVDCLYGAATALYLLGDYEEARVRFEACNCNFASFVC
jgi:TolA-binding protein